VEWFATAEEAEEKKSKLLLALLWAAISRKYPLLLDYQTSLIYDRTQHGGTIGGVSAQLHLMMNSCRLVDLINEIFSDENIEVEEKLLVSMELFTSARLETSDRAKFVGLVSSLEPLAQSEAYGNPELEKLVDNFVNQLTDTSIPDNINKQSLKDRIRDLKKESISQAIQRIVQESIPANENEKAVSIIKDAYNIRSTILHEGSTDADLEQKSNEIENIIRQIYSHRLKPD
jgi:Apea-like HEPN